MPRRTGDHVHGHDGNRPAKKPLTAALVESLPKSIRKSFVPVPDTAERCRKALVPGDAPLARALALELEKTSGVFSGVPCEPGTTFTGASLTAVTAMPRVAEPVNVPSFAVKVTVRVCPGAIGAAVAPGTPGTVNPTGRVARLTIVTWTVSPTCTSSREGDRCVCG